MVNHFTSTPESPAATVGAIVRSTLAGLRWLKQFAEDLSDPRDIAIAASALIAAERNPRSHLVQRLTSNLLRRQCPNGSWSDELWDTTWAIKALHAAGLGPEHSAINSGLRFCDAVQDPFRGSWYEEPFETMLVLDLIATITPCRIEEIGRRAIDWLLSLQNNDGFVIGARYTGMAVSLFRHLSGADKSPFSPFIDAAVRWLRADVAGRPMWTAAAWSNYYPLRALLDVGYTIDDAVVSTALAWFLNNQDDDGKWMQVSRVHDTSMSIMILSRLLAEPIVGMSQPKVGIIGANRENGTHRVVFQNPGAGAVTPSERLKVSDAVRVELGSNQQHLLTLAGRFRTKTKAARRTRRDTAASQEKIHDELVKIGRYAYGHLIPSRIQGLLDSSTADHLRLDVDERLIDLPWELLHDGIEFLCLKYALGRQLVSDQNFVSARRASETLTGARVLIVANPTSDLPAAEDEGEQVARLFDGVRGVTIKHFCRSEMTKKDFLLSLGDYDIVHFAGHATHDARNPDESCLLFGDGEIKAFEIARFIGNKSPAVVFLNACWSAEELRRPDAYPAMIRGLGRTFIYAGVTAFLGYLVPVPDLSATALAVAFYGSLTGGQTIGESLRLARLELKDRAITNDLTWASAVLYGDPSVRIISPERQAY